MRVDYISLYNDDPVAARVTANHGGVLDSQDDPFGVAASLNLYQYVGNNPASYVDPFGLCPGCLAFLATPAGQALTATTVTATALAFVQTKDAVGNLGRDLATSAQSGIMDWIRKQEDKLKVLAGVLGIELGKIKVPPPGPDEATVEELLDRAPPTIDDGRKPPSEDD